MYKYGLKRNFRGKKPVGWSLFYKGRLLRKIPPEAVIFMKDVYPVVKEGGRKESKRTGQKSVHSFLGTDFEPVEIAMDPRCLSLEGYVRIDYQPPFRGDKGWHYLEGGSFGSSSEVICCRNGEVFALRLRANAHANCAAI